MSRETYALLISGNEERSADKVARFKIFLINELNCDPKRIYTIVGTEARLILGKTLLFFERVKRENSLADVVILYCGHGYQGTFYPHGELSYRDWGRLIDHDGNFIFINDSCYSGSAIDSFRGIGLLPEKGLVHASCSKDEESWDQTCFLDKLIESYLNNQIFRRKKIGEREYTTIYRLGWISPPKGKRMFDPENITVGFDEQGRRIVDPTRDKYGVVKLPPRVYKRPKIEGKIQHPQRAGRTLDYLLFKEGNIR